MKKISNLLLFLLITIGAIGCYKKNSKSDGTTKTVVVIEEESESEEPEEVELSYVLNKLSLYEYKNYITLSGSLSNSDMILNIYNNTDCNDIGFWGVVTKDLLEEGVDLTLIENSTNYLSYVIYYKDEKIVDCKVHALVNQDSIAPNAPQSNLEDTGAIVTIENNFVFPYFLNLSGVDEDVSKVRFYKEDGSILKEINYLTLVANQGYITVESNLITSVYASFIDKAGNESGQTKLVTLYYSDNTPGQMDISQITDQFSGVKASIDFNFTYTLENENDVLIYDLGKGDGPQEISYTELRDTGINFLYNEYGSYNITFKVKRAEKYSEIQTVNAYIGSSNPNFSLSQNTIVFDEPIDKTILFSIQNLSTDLNFGIGIPITPTMTNVSSGITYVNHEFDCLRLIEYENYCEMELQVNHTTNGTYTDTFTLNYEGQSIVFTIQYNLEVDGL